MQGLLTMEMSILTPEIVTKPTSEPLTITEAKKQVELSANDTAHDEHLRAAIIAAREQWEHDTDSAMCYQTWRIKTDRICDGIQLPKRPINSITSIYYYNTSNSSTLLSSSYYNLDTPKRQIRLAYNYEWPDSLDRWDAWTITYKLGYSQDGQSVPGIAKQAMLLLVGYYFNKNRGDNDGMHDNRAYESLVARYLRSSYP